MLFLRIIEFRFFVCFLIIIKEHQYINTNLDISFLKYIFYKLMNSNSFKTQSAKSYRIVSVIDQNMALTLKEKTFNLRLQPFNKKTHHQSIHIYDHSRNGQLSIMSFINSPLSIAADSDQNGALIKFGFNGSSKSLTWKIEQVTSGQWAGKAYYIRSFCGKSLDIFGNITPEGNDVGQWDFHGGINQQFLIEYFDSQEGQKKDSNLMFTPKIGTKYYIISAKDSSKFLTVDKNLKLIATSYEGQTSQQFKSTLHNNRYSLLNVLYDKNISVEHPNDGKQIICCDAYYQANFYQIVQNNQGEWAKKGYLIKDFNGKYALDLTSEKVSNGSKVVVWTVHNGGNQTWQIISVEQYDSHHQKVAPVVQQVGAFSNNMGSTPTNPWPSHPQPNLWHNNQPVSNNNQGFSTSNPWPSNPQPNPQPSHHPQSNPWKTPNIPTSQSQNPYTLPIKQPASFPHIEHPIKTQNSLPAHNHLKHHHYFANKKCIIRSATHPNKVLAYHKGWMHQYLVIEDYTGEFNQNFYIFQATRKLPQSEKDFYQIICMQTGNWIFMPHPQVGESMQLRNKQNTYDFFKFKQCTYQYGSEDQHHKYFYIVQSTFQGYSFQPHGYANDSKIQVRKFEDSPKQLWKIDPV